MTALAGGAQRAQGRSLDADEREQARAAILGLMSQGPLERLGMREAAKAAGLSLATLYKYFGGKEALPGAVLAPDLEALVAAMDAASRTAVGVKARLQGVLGVLCDFARTHPDAASALWLHLPPSTWESGDGGWRAQRLRIVSHILRNGQRDGSVRADVDDTPLAQLMLGAADRAIEVALADPGAEAPAGERLFARLWPLAAA
ncbi:TetR/AcrR family transcriptional regulator [Hyphomonadaceae bacterium BL14]|nr:TetR/AcrR family transcriptional regulator [Hyphomonadaceae bacterium BL14]